jgi:hypothetical protein
LVKSALSKYSANNPFPVPMKGGGGVGLGGMTPGPTGRIGFWAMFVSRRVMAGKAEEGGEIEELAPIELAGGKAMGLSFGKVRAWSKSCAIGLRDVRVSRGVGIESMLPMTERIADSVKLRCKNTESEDNLKSTPKLYGDQGRFTQLNSFFIETLLFVEVI